MHAVMGAGRLIGGRYRLQEPIGRGAMGIVWHGRDEVLARDVAVKEVQVTSQVSPAEAEVIYQRTLREARTAARLSHPGVVKVFDVVEEAGSPWIVMELVRARSLDRVITEDGTLTPEQAADLGTSLVGALAAAHSSGVLHRDVKPSNVLVTAEGRAVLTDFGIATFAEDLALTQAGMVVGTPGFTAPERIRGEIATPAADMWSLGATLYTAVEGHGPFDRNGGSAQISTGVANEDAPRAQSAGPLAPVIGALLSRDPGTRPDAATAERLLAAAATAARTTPRPLPGPAEPGRAAPAGTGGRTAAAVIGGAGLPATALADGPDGPSPGSVIDPGSGPVPWGPVKSTCSRPAAGPPGGAGDGEGGGSGQGGGPGDGAGGPGSRDGKAAQPAWRSPGRRRLIVAAGGTAALIAAALAGWIAFQHSGPASALGSTVPPGTATQPSGPGQPGSHPSAGSHNGSAAPGVGAPGSGPATGPSASPSSSGSPSPSPSGTPAPSPSGSGPTLPAGYRWHRFTALTMGTAAGFKIGMPDLWTQTVSPPVAEMSQSVRDFHLLVDLSSWLYSEPVREAQYVQNQAASAHKGHGYKELLLTKTNFTSLGGFRSAAAAELRYSWHSSVLGYGETELVILVTLNTSAGPQPYEFELVAPTQTAGSADSVLSAALPTFRPLPG